MYPTTSPVLGDFDEKIAPLVQSINALGIKTWYSCEGHEYGGSDYPTVMLSCTVFPEELEKKISIYNKDANVGWGLVQWGKDWVKMSPLHPSQFCLMEMQNSIAKLVCFL